MKLEKEITVQVNCSYNQLHKQLLDQGFQIMEQYQLHDTYMAPTDIDLHQADVSDLLKSCILIRDVVNVTKVIVHKYKQYDSQGAILEQGKTECEIMDIDQAISFMNAIQYHVLFRIHDTCIVYTNHEIELTVQLVNNRYIFIEMEDLSKSTGKVFESIEAMIQELAKLKLDYNKNNYFVKKAELVFYDTYCI